jgi:hypothetical protein
MSDLVLLIRGDKRSPLPVKKTKPPAKPLPVSTRSFQAGAHLPRPPLQPPAYANYSSQKEAHIQLHLLNLYMC